MKVLPCRSDSCARRRNKTVPYTIALLPGRTPYTMLSWGLPIAEMSYRCDGCRRKTRLSAMEFTQLPTLSLMQLREIGADNVTPDVLGGLTPEQALAVLPFVEDVPVAELVARR